MLAVGPQVPFSAPFPARNPQPAHNPAHFLLCQDVKRLPRARANTDCSSKLLLSRCDWLFFRKKNNAGPDPKLESSVYSLLDERGARNPASLPFLLLRVKDLWQNEGSRQCCDPKGCAL